MARVIKQTIIDDIAAIKTEFPTPFEQQAVIEAYLKTAGSIFIETV